MFEELHIIPKVETSPLVLKNLTELISADNNTVLCFDTAIGEYKINVSFPTLGGVRICGETKGYFSPENTKKIDYSTTNGKIVLNAGNVDVKITTGQDWEIKITDGKKVIAYNYETLKLGVQKTEVKKVYVCGNTEADEVICGFGEKFNTMNQIGRKLPLRNQDTAYHGHPEEGDKSFSYKSIPIFHSSKKYTIFFNTFYSGIADLTVNDNSMYQIEFLGNVLDVFIWFGNIDETLDSYTALTGRTLLPPKWAFKYWAGGSAAVWKVNGEENFAEVVREYGEGYKNLGTMPSGLYGEGLPSQHKAGYDAANEYGMRMFVWNHPGVDVAINWYTPEHIKEVLPELPYEEYPLFKKDGEYCTRGWIDYTHPRAKDVMHSKFEEFFPYGLKGAMVDYGEYIEDAWDCYNGMKGEQMHNCYPYFYNQRINEQFSEALGDDFVLFARAGCAGSQRWANTFGGDQASQFYGLRQAIKGGLNAGLSGFPMWGSDIGGLCGVPSPELYIRWLQFSAMSPFMRTHGTNDHNPWTFGEDAVRIFKKFFWLREALLDYMYHTAIQSYKSGIPMMRTMLTAFPEEKTLWDTCEQYMFGDWLLVAPITEEGATQKHIVLPAGNWYDLLTGEKYSGEIDYSAPLDTMPIFLREGAVLPLLLPQDGMMCEDNTVDTVNALALALSIDGRYEINLDKETAIFVSCEKNSGIYSINNENEYKFGIVKLYGITVKGVMADNVGCEFKVDGGITTVKTPNSFKTLKVII